MSGDQLIADTLLSHGSTWQPLVVELHFRVTWSSSSHFSRRLKNKSGLFGRQRTQCQEQQNVPQFRHGLSPLSHFEWKWSEKMSVWVPQINQNKVASGKNTGLLLLLLVSIFAMTEDNSAFLRNASSRQQHTQHKTRGGRCQRLA